MRAILCLWSGLFAFLSIGAASAFAKAPWQGERFPTVIAAAQLAELAAQKVEERLAELGETRRHELHLQRAARTMRLPAGEATAVVEFPRGLPYGREFPAAIFVYVDGVLQRRATNYYKLTVYDRVLVATADIRAEESPSPANARLEEAGVDTPPEATLTDFGKIGGRVAAHYIRKGTVITPSMLAMPLVLRAGSPVELLVEVNGIAVRTAGVALESGRIGYTIRVRNVSSGKILRGRIMDAQTVKIGG